VKAAARNSQVKAADANFWLSRDWRLLTAALLLSDLAAMLVAFYLASLVVWKRGVGINGGNDSDWLIAVMVPVLVLLFYWGGLYDPANLLVGAREFGGVFRSSAYGLVLLTLITFVLRWPLSRSWAVLSWAFLTLFVIAARFLIRRVAAFARNHGRLIDRALVVGVDEESVALAEQVNQRGSGMEVVGLLDDYVPAGTELPGGLRVVGTSSALLQVAHRMHVRDAIISPRALPWETLRELVTTSTAHANGLRLHLSAGLYDLLTAGVRFAERNHVPLLTLRKARLSTTERVLKGTLDVSLATVLMVALAPVVGVMMLWQLAHGSRLVIEREPVLGRNGQPFKLLRFRSTEPFHSSLIAKFPGLVNVLRGELSLVGPQPAAVATSVPPAIQPGLTGPWRQAIDPAEQSTLDLYYVRSYSVWLDIAVLYERAMVRLRPLTKRSVDLLGATILLIVTSPLIAIAMIAVLLDDGAPVIYRRRVVGRGGQVFDAFKVRTMVKDADRRLSEDATLQQAFRTSNKLVSDPRITRVGRWLRRLSLDELPQLVNVLRGEMSLVGPRMITLAELPEWGDVGRLLLSVRPGLTGLWQVSGRQLLSKADRIRLDAEYVRRMSVRLDLSILARTFFAVFSGRGAY
jgi:lipopolysaccharide/colanic/teichoic acid biosynthesis glycosyltransferase